MRYPALTLIWYMYLQSQSKIGNLFLQQTTLYRKLQTPSISLKYLINRHNAMSTIRPKITTLSIMVLREGLDWFHLILVLNIAVNYVKTTHTFTNLCGIKTISYRNYSIIRSLCCVKISYIVIDIYGVNSE